MLMVAPMGSTLAAMGGDTPSLCSAQLWLTGRVTSLELLVKATAWASSMLLK